VKPFGGKEMIGFSEKAVERGGYWQEEPQQGYYESNE
jgi:hypothetical protein